MKLRIKHKGSELEFEDDYQYGNCIDLKQFVLAVIEKTIHKINESC